MGITKFVLKRPVTTVLAILCLIVYGIQSITGATLELTPEMDMSMLIVYTTYNGASPEDVDELVTKPIEDSVSTLSGLDNISSTSSEGSSMVMLEYEYGTDMDEAYDDLKKKVDLIASTELPEDADTPNIIEMSSAASADITLVVDNPAEENLYNYVENEIVPEFEKLSDAAEVVMTGGAEEYIKVELVQEKMDQYGVTMSSVAADIAAADISYPVESTKVGSQEYSVSAKMNYDTLEALAEIPLTVSGNGAVFLQDVAVITTASNEGESVARYNGRDTISLQITKQQSSTAMSLSGQVEDTIRSLTAGDPNLTVTVVNDSSDNIMESLMSVAETMVMAVVISMAIIWLFFGDWKASLIVGSSIPVSILAALVCMRAMGLTLNVITLSALTLGVGMMVDNSIVVLESCFRVTADRKGGFVEYLKDALEGTHIVAASVLASTATTCVVFLPLAMLNGMTGQLLGPLGYTIVFCMAASLLSSITVVPLCYMLYRPKEKGNAPLSRPVERLQDSYRKIMRTLLPRKKLVMGISVALLAVSFLAAVQLDVELMASDDQGQVSITVETRPGMETEKVDQILRQVEDVISGHEDLDAYMTTAGGGGMMSGGSASITAYLKDDRKMDTEEVAAQWKKELQDISDCTISVDVSGSMSMMSSFGESFEAILQGTDYEEVRETAQIIMDELSQRPEVSRVHSDAENAAPTVEITVDGVKAKAVGLTAASIGSTLNQMVSGVEAAELEMDGETISVMVEYPEDSYQTLDQLRNIVLTTADRGSVLLTDVADISFQDSPSSITKQDRQYRVTVTAEYTDQATEETPAILLQEVVTPHLTETVTTGINAMDQSMNEELSALFGAIVMAVFLVFVVMAAQFESPRFSLMVMMTIPFSLIGAFGLLWLGDSAISMISMVGFLMLAGTVVNAGILYVDTVNQYRTTMDRDTALIEAGATRMRPILMTTLTTILSMIPMAFAIGNSGEMTRGLALVNIGGLTASTILSLLMLPVFYTIMDKTPKELEQRREREYERDRRKSGRRSLADRIRSRLERRGRKADDRK